MDALLSIVDEFSLGTPELVDVIVSLLLATGLGLLIARIYRATNRGLNFELHFVTTLILLAPIVAVVMLFIRGDLVLSLGLIGSLSIIRFRTPIKDTRDMIFLFWTIAVGLGAGTYNWSVIIVATAVIAVLALTVYRFQPSASIRSDFVLVLEGEGSVSPDDLVAAVRTEEVRATVRSLEMADGRWEVVLELTLSNVSSRVIDGIVANGESLPSVRRISLLAPQVALPV
jgi:hypothetical protein